MTKTPWIVGAALAATLAAAGYAQAEHGPPRTRAELQAKIAEHFKKADTNGDGYVTKAEFDAARETMKAKFAEKREEHREKEFAMLDANKDGQLSKAEFMAPPPHHDGMGGPEGPGGPDGDHEHGHHGGWMMHGHGMHGGMAMMMMGHGGDEWFARADANHDGKVSLAEAEAGPLAMFDRADTNHDGTVSPEEHEAARAAMRAKWQEHRGGEHPQG